MKKAPEFLSERGEIISAVPKSGTITIGGDLTVYRMGYGAMRLCGPGIWGWPEDRENALRILRRVVDLGINFIDTADAYGPEVNELQIAQALYPYPEGLVIATKGGNTRPGPGQWVPDCRPERLKRSCEESLKRLRLEAIDLYQLHSVDPNVPWAEQVGALRDLCNEGKIRHAALSNVTLQQLREAETIVPIVSVQNRYNIAYRGESEQIIDYCERNHIAFLPWFPLGAGDGDISDNTEVQVVAKAHGVHVYEVALAWLLHRSPVMLPIPGTSKVEHLEQNVCAGTIRLSDEELVRLGLRQPKSAHHGEHDER
jgi:aryl-alcohol dehydrogenase-like predicted oxidoreductase